MPLEKAEKLLEFSRRVLKSDKKKSDEDIDDEIDRLFEMIDLDGNGKIEVEELQQALAKMTSNDARHVFAVPDEDDIGGDAESVELRRVFLLRLLKSMRTSGINDTKALLEVADLDQDGSIDREEMRRVMRKARNAVKRKRLGASGMI
jgi:Ca2+-binding EF-hand superfamily protein